MHCKEGKNRWPAFMYYWCQNKSEYLFKNSIKKMKGEANSLVPFPVIISYILTLYSAKVDQHTCAEGCSSWLGCKTQQ